MSGAFRRPAVVDASAGSATPKVTTTSVPARVERFTAEQAQDPVVLSAQLTRVVQNQADADHESNTSPLRGPTVYKRLAVGIGASKTIIRHGLGRRAFWWVVGWSGSTTAAGHDLVCDEDDGVNVVTDSNTLALRSYVAGTVDVAVA